MIGGLWNIDKIIKLKFVIFQEYLINHKDLFKNHSNQF